MLTAAVAAGGSVALAAPLALAQPIGTPITGARVPLTTLSIPDRPAAQALAGVSLSPAEVTVQVPANFTLDVLVNCGTHADAAGVEVTFDPAYMQVVTVTQDEAAFPNVLRNRFDNASGIVYYDTGAALTCHADGNCPAGVIRVATITFQATGRTFPTKTVGIHGQVVWAGDLIFNGQGNGSTITITSTAPLSLVYLPSVVRGARSDTSSTPLIYHPSDSVEE
jgi:hypothetical protein